MKELSERLCEDARPVLYLSEQFAKQVCFVLSQSVYINVPVEGQWCMDTVRVGAPCALTFA